MEKEIKRILSALRLEYGVFWCLCRDVRNRHTAPRHLVRRCPDSLHDAGNRHLAGCIVHSAVIAHVSPIKGALCKQTPRNGRFEKLSPMERSAPLPVAGSGVAEPLCILLDNGYSGTALRRNGTVGLFVLCARTQPPAVGTWIDSTRRKRSKIG